MYYLRELTGWDLVNLNNSCPVLSIHM